MQQSVWGHKDVSMANAWEEGEKVMGLIIIIHHWLAWVGPFFPNKACCSSRAYWLKEEAKSSC